MLDPSGCIKNNREYSPIKADALKSSKNKEETSLPDEVEDAILEIGGLEKLSSQIPKSSELDHQLTVHKALADVTRLKILWALKCCDLCPCVLKEYLKISDSKLSYHLSVLEEAGLVSSYPKKNWRIFSITIAGSEALSQSNQSQSGGKSTKKGGQIR